MINYLNNPKRLFVALTTTAALAGSLSLASCQDYDNGFDDEKIFAKEYSDNFKKYFGEFDPNHDWGFGKIPGGKSTLTRVNVDEKNLWEEKYHLVVPGWPDVYQSWVNGLTITGQYHAATTNNEDCGYIAEKNYTSYVPAGDVTDEEIQYVSWWFRTHPNIKSEYVHWSDFYIQEISSDNDRFLGGDNDGEINDALYKYTKNNSTTVKEGQPVDGFKLSYLEVKTLDGIVNSSETSELGAGYEHIGKFNRNSSNTLHNNNKLVMQCTSDTTAIWHQSLGATDTRVCGFYTSSGTEDFACKNTNDNTWNHLWVIRHLVFKGPSGRLYDGWYLGFDYEFLKVDGTGRNYPKPANEENFNSYQYHDRDFTYSNWILKITPAIPLEAWPPTGFTRRVMCEDLGNTFDYDFNDVVFDVTYNMTQAEYNAYQSGDPVDATITIRAAGGTLPIFVGKDPSNDAYEAHKIMGWSDSRTPLNVGGKTGSVGIYHITANSLDPDDIKIYVINSGNYADKNGVAGANDAHLVQESKYVSLNQSAPQKFACPNNVQWMKETEFIDTGYPYFRKWAKEPNGDYKEYLDADKISTNPRAWFFMHNNEASEKGHIYQYQKISAASGSSDTPSLLASPFNVSTQAIAITLSATPGSVSTIDLHTYIDRGLRDDSNFTVTEKSNNGVVSIGEDMVITPLKAGSAVISLSYPGNETHRSAALQVMITVTKNLTTAFKQTNPGTVQLSVGEDFNLDNFVYNDAKSGISVTKINGVDVVTIPSDLSNGIKVIAQGSETIRIQYTGDSFREEYQDITIAVSAPSPFAAGYTSGSTSENLKYYNEVTDAEKTLDLSKYIKSGLNVSDFTVSITSGNDVVSVSGNNIVAQKTGEARVTMTYNNGSSSYAQNAQLVINITVKDPNAREYGVFYEYDGDFSNCGNELTKEGNNFKYDKNNFDVNNKKDIILTFKSSSSNANGQINNSINIPSNGSYQVILKASDWYSNESAYKYNGVDKDGISVNYYNGSADAIYIKFAE